MARSSIERSPSEKSRIMIVPDIDHMLRYISKEEFACQKLFGGIPRAKGAIAGEAGRR